MIQVYKVTRNDKKHVLANQFRYGGMILYVKLYE